MNSSPASPCRGCPMNRRNFIARGSAAAAGVLAKFVPLAAIPAAAAADQRHGSLNASGAAFAAIASRVITPFTPEHAAWTLATSNPVAGQWVRWEEWMPRASAPTP